MARRMRPLAVTGGLLLAAAVTTALVCPTAAQAVDSLGTVTVDPATGSDVLAPKVHTSGGCPTTSDGYNAVLAGPGAFAAGYLITATQDPGFSTTAGFDVQLGVSFADAATDLGTTITAGDYIVTVNCVDSFSQDVMGAFAGLVRFTSPTAYVFDPAVTPRPTTTPAPTTKSPTPTGTKPPDPTIKPTPTATDPTEEPTTDPTRTPTPTATTRSPATGGGLPITGPPIAALLAIGTLLVGAGAAAIAAAGTGRHPGTARS